MRWAGGGNGSRTRCRKSISRRSSGCSAIRILQLVVAENGEGVIGCLQLCILPGVSSQGASRGLIQDVRVASDCRSRGIGEQLVQWACTEARARGCQLVELLTHHTRVDAQRFYERLGFARSHVGMTIRF